MKVIGCDTNVILDYFFKRKPGFVISQKLFEAVTEGSIFLFIPSVVILELEWVMRSYYGLSKSTVIEYLNSLIEIPNVEMPDKSVVRSVVSYYQSNRGISFTDSMILHLVKQNKVHDFVTSDRKLKRLYERL